MENLLSLQAMARRLNVRPQDLKREALAGMLPSIRVGDSLLFDPAKVERAIMERASESEVRHDA